MSLTDGTRLGPYEIVAPIGAGGMGEVYRARDTKLDRDVAIKVLPDEFAKDLERLTRFEREAKLLASLNHPNIASIHGFQESDGINALVLELVEGPTLAERIAEGAIPVDEAITIAKQIAEALEAGHEAGVVHRDLKPANIKLKEDGTVKVLDYGLAKALESESPAGPETELSQSPTLTRRGTQVGVILGTAAYMSPEQAKGKRVDRRADIWAFGAVLYEMLTGQRAFRGEDVSDTLAAVLRAEPDWGVLPADAPASIRLVLRLCLDKNVAQRFQSVGDVRLALGGSFDVPVPASEAAPTKPRTFVGAAAVVIAALVAGTLGWNLRRPDEPRVARLTASTPRASAPRVSNARRDIAISPGGDWFVYYGVGDTFYMRHIDRVDTERLDLVGASEPFVSPDGAWLGFHASNALQRMPIEGGPATTICELGGSFLGASWGDEGTVVFGTRSGLFRVSASGGEPEQLTDSAQDGALRHGEPEMLPGEKALFFVSERADSVFDISVLSLETGEQRELVRGATSPRYLETGHIAYVSGGALMVAPFDASSLELDGEAVSLFSGIGPKFSGVTNYDVSDNGVLIYLAGDPEGGAKSLYWVDRQGREERIELEPRAYTSMALSPDGERLVTSIQDANGYQDFWVQSLTRGTQTRLTFDASGGSFATWTPDGEQVIFRSESRRGLFRKAADGTGAIEPVSEQYRDFRPFSLSPDGRRIVGVTNEPDTQWDVVELTLDDEPELRPLLAGPYNQWYPEIAPSGNWLLYLSRESGRPEVFICPYPDVDAGRWQVSVNGGEYPTWSPKEDEVFYRRADEMIAVPITFTEDGAVEPGAPSVLFEGYYDTGGSRHYDVSGDAERFIMMKAEASGGDRNPNEIQIVLNWFQELKRVAPE